MEKKDGYEVKLFAYNQMWNENSDTSQTSKSFEPVLSSGSSSTSNQHVILGKLGNPSDSAILYLRHLVVERVDRMTKF